MVSYNSRRPLSINYFNSYGISFEQLIDSKLVSIKNGLSISREDTLVYLHPYFMYKLWTNVYQLPSDIACDRVINSLPVTKEYLINPSAFENSPFFRLFKDTYPIELIESIKPTNTNSETLNEKHSPTELTGLFNELLVNSPIKFQFESK